MSIIYNNWKGVFLSILSGSGAHGYLYECRGQKTVEDFKTCILQKSDSFIKDIGMKSYRQATYISGYAAAQMIFPEDGSIGVKQTDKATLKLDPLFQYIFCLFDKDFLLFVRNPMIVLRSCIKISQNSSFTPIPIKVGISLIQKL